MQVSVTDIIALLTTLLLFIFSFFLFNVNKGNKVNHLLLAAFLFTNAMYLIGYLLFSFFDYIQPNGVHFLFIGKSFGFLFGPLLLFYVKSLINDNFKLKYADLIHVIPFLGFNLIYSFYYYFKSTTAKIEMLSSGHILPYPLGFWVNLTLNVQILIYMAVILLLLFNYNRRIKSLYSTIHNLKLDWLELIVYAFLFMWLIDFAHFLLINTGLEINPETSGFLTFISISINFVFANLIIYKGLNQSVHFFRIEKELPKGKYESTPLSEQEKNTYLEKLIAFMSNEKPYLTSTLTLKELAERTEMNPRIISRIINEEKKQNFFDFINSYRIEDAKMILSNPAKRKMTILEILYGVGFNSKTVFNTTFKKYTGFTPTQYRKKYLPHRSHHIAQKSA